MTLNEQQLKQITNNGVYECLFTKQRFGIALFEEPSPLGSLICFESPVKIGVLSLPDCFVICGELPNVNIFGGVCFQRLYSAQLGSILQQICGLECYVDQNCLFTNEKQCSLTIVNTIKDSAMFHIIFPKVVDIEGFQPLELTKEQMEIFQQHCLNSFDQLKKSVFLETRRDNI
jgi:hypothetical protein